MFFGTLFILACLRSCCGHFVLIKFKQSPFHFIILIFLVTLLGLMLGVISSYHNTIAIMLAIIIILIVSIGITLLSLQTKYDFTSCFHYLLMVTLLFAFISSGLIVAILSLFDTNNSSNNMIYTGLYSALAAVLIVLYLTIMVQMIISGNRKFKLTKNDYVFICLQLYFDLYYFIFFICEKNE
jgi:protein lifeguard